MIKNNYRLWILLVVVSLALRFFYCADFLNFRSGLNLPVLTPGLEFFLQRNYSEDLLCRQKLKIQQETIVELKNNLKDLERQAKISGFSNPALITARILVFDQDEIQVDVGSSEGVKKNNLAIFGKRLVGKVLEVEAERSRIGLLDNPQVKITCYAKNGGLLIWGNLEGEGNDKILLKKILPTKKITIENEVFCGQYLAGYVSKISEVKGEFFLQARVRPALAPENFDHVFIEK